MTVTIFHGTEAETRRLLTAIEHSCECRRTNGNLIATCASHKALLDQRFLDWLLFYLRTREALIEREWAEVALTEDWGEA